MTLLGHETCVSVMASFEEEPTSLDKEEAFIASTCNVARLFFDIHHKQKAMASSDLKFGIKRGTKGIGPSRTLPSPTAAGEDSCQDDELARAAEYVGQRLRGIADGNESIVERAFNRYIGSLTNTVLDIDYEVFRRTMADVINTHQDKFNQVVLIFAGACHISEALREVGNDPHRQSEYARYVGRFIVEQGLMPVVDKLGGWAGIGQSLADRDGTSN